MSDALDRLAGARELHAAAHELPDEPGCYAFWLVDRDALPGITHAHAHPAEPWSLVYFGISRSLLQRVVGNHRGGNIAGSTLRFGLASLLWRERGWQPRLRSGGKYGLARSDEHDLTAWMDRNLRIAWFVDDAAKATESRLMPELSPPLNSSENTRHPFAVTLGAARDGLRAAARGVPAGRYRHFKGPEYAVLGTARHSETGEVLVVYRPLVPKDDYAGLWVRPLAMFTENVEHEGRAVPRFERVHDA